MCQIFNTIGSLTALKSQLHQHNIHDFKSVKEVIEFQQSDFLHQKRIIAHHQELIEQEKQNLQIDLRELESTIATQKVEKEQLLTEELDILKLKLSTAKAQATNNIVYKLIGTVKQWHYQRTIYKQERTFEAQVSKWISNSVKIHHEKSIRSQFITSSFSQAVCQSSEFDLVELERKKRIIKTLNNFVYGAVGEQKVVRTLEALSDEWYLINDFDISLDRPIYYSEQNEYIRSIQIDHILVGPAGVFLIETKNWSKKSLNNLNLRSPIEQVRRSSFVLFLLLNSQKSTNYLRKHHWGDKKIAIKNAVVFMENKPKAEFQYVKVLTLDELLGYINYFNPVFSATATKQIADYLLQLNRNKVIDIN